MKLSLRHIQYRAGLFCLAGLLLSASAPAATTGESDIEIPMTVKGAFGDTQIRLEAREYKPKGDGPFPLLIINHGSPRSAQDRPTMKPDYKLQARLFAKHGFIVMTPMRRGYGKSEGGWAEDYFKCSNPAYFNAGLEGAKDIQATIDFARTQKDVDARHIVLLGKSAGGFAVLALSSLNPEGVIGTINFAGGRGSVRPDEVCGEDSLVQTFSRYAGTTRIPMLWFYAQNDHFFGPAIAQRLAGAYTGQHVDMKLITPPPYKNEGHNFFNARENQMAWLQEVIPFLEKIGLKTQADSLKTYQGPVEH
jgi:dienelactone hydrolase